MFCRIRECYASEIGMCEPVLYFDDSDSCWQANEYCFCMNWDNHVGEFPWPEWFPGQRMSQIRLFSWVWRRQSICNVIAETILRGVPSEPLSGGLLKILKCGSLKLRFSKIFCNRIFCRCHLTTHISLSQEAHGPNPSRKNEKVDFSYRRVYTLRRGTSSLIN